jgi:hypothetical protein
MRIIGKIKVDKLPESCSSCEFVCDAYGGNMFWRCMLNDCKIPRNKRYSRPYWCKLIEKEKAK